MNRRDTALALLGLAALPIGSGAQQPGRVYRIGFLLADPKLGTAFFDRPLAKLGWIVGQNVMIESRYSEGRMERLPELAAELVRLNVDVIVTFGGPETEATKQATKSIPIVFIAHGDPVGRGHVASLAKPGGNITGASQMLPELCGKRLQLLKEILPGASRIAVLWNAANPTKQLDWRVTQDAARTLQLTLDSFEVKGPNDFQAAFDAIQKAKPDGLMTLEDPLTGYMQAATVEFASSAHLPAIYGVPGYVSLGGLMSYGITLDEFILMSTVYIDKILRGAKPADLPVQQSTVFHLEVNLKTAKALKLTIPPTILARADTVIS